MKVRVLAAYAVALCLLATSLGSGAATSKGASSTIGTNRTDGKGQAKKKPTTLELILAQVINSVGQVNPRAAVQIRIDKNGTITWEDLTAVVQVPLKKDLSAPLGERSGDSSQTDGLIPDISFQAENLIVEATSAFEATDNGIVKVIVQFRKKGSPKQGTLRVTIRNSLGKVFDVDIKQLKVTFAGVNPNAGRLQINGSCSILQNQLDVDTGNLAPVDAKCKIYGFFSRTDDNREFHIGYDSLHTQP